MSVGIDESSFRSQPPECIARRLIARRLIALATGTLVQGACPRQILADTLAILVQTTEEAAAGW